MNYITTDDLTSLMKENIFNDISEENYSILNEIEKYSVGEISAYLSFKFDVIAALRARNVFLIMLLIDIFAYHLSTRMTHTSMQEIREVRYNNAKEMLLYISLGKITPDLPLKEEAAGEFISKNLFDTKQRYSYLY